MSIDRRDFLKFSTGMLLMLSPLSRSFANNKTQGLLSCRAGQDGYFFTAISETGKVLFNTALPSRGHGICVRPDETECAVFARRPGDFLLIVDLQNGQVRHRMLSREDRHFYGHGVYSHDNRLLFTTENDFEQGVGVIGVYDVKDDYRRLGELPSHGIGPHELKLLSDGNTLVIANGGIKTHPDYDRVKLNLDDMQPNLAYVDTANGNLLSSYRPPEKWHQLSIRHLDVNQNDEVFIAMQYEGSSDQSPPLVARHQGQDALQLLEAPAEIQKQMNNYCGSVSYDSSGQLVAVSSPRGNLITLWSSGNGRFLKGLTFPDSCGLARDETAGCFQASNGVGTLARVQYPGSPSLLATRHWETWQWDNHMVPFVASWHPGV